MGLKQRPLVHYVLWKVGLAKPDTATTKDEQAALVRHARGRKDCVEIGVWHGSSTVLLREAIAPGGTLYAIDPFFPGRFGWCVQKWIAHREVERVKNGNVVWVEKLSKDAVNDVPEKLDFMFVDGAHGGEGVKADWELWSKRIKPGGRICLHDTRLHPGRDQNIAKSVEYTNTVILKDPAFKLIEQVDSLTVMEKV